MNVYITTSANNKYLDTTIAILKKHGHQVESLNDSYIKYSDIIIIIIPCNYMSYIEIGYAKGIGKKIILYCPIRYTLEIEKMKNFFDMITDSIYDILYYLIVKN